MQRAISPAPCQDAVTAASVTMLLKIALVRVLKVKG